MVFPRIRCRFDRGELIRTVIAGDGTTHSGEVWIDGGWVLVTLVNVATGSVRLPNLDELSTNRTAIAVEDTATDFDALADGFAVVLDGQIDSRR